MRRMVGGALAILVVAGLAVTGLSAENQADAPETVTFDLHYRALTLPNDPLSYRSFWGFGSSPPANEPFVEAVKEKVQEFDPVYNPSLSNCKWSVVELKDKKPVAFYFDLDGDGKLSDNERIPPTTTTREQSGNYPYTFITPDFVLRPDDGREIPFRVILVADSFGGDRLQYMWSPSCILEGQAVFAGVATRLLLYGNGFSGSFSDFGRCNFVLVPATQKIEGYVPRAMLSSLICQDGTFYKLSLEGSHEKDKTLQVKLTEDTSPTGRAMVSLKGKDALKTRLTNATIVGDGDDTIRFSMGNAESVMPVGKYKLTSGYVCYGVESDDQWQVNFNDGPAFAIAKDEKATIDLGDLSLTISAVSERERYRSDVKEKSTYAEGTPIYLAPQIKGKAGEVYMRFSQKSDEGNRWTAIKPHVAILDADGKEVASADMEYG